MCEQTQIKASQVQREPWEVLTTEVTDPKDTVKCVECGVHIRIDEISCPHCGE